jgi:hypothetical protein
MAFRREPRKKQKDHALDWAKKANLDAPGVTEPSSDATVFIERT